MGENSLLLSPMDFSLLGFRHKHGGLVYRD
nr:MAG TPA: hypothetical protein [Bacteriophage sp.]